MAVTMSSAAHTAAVGPALMTMRFGIVEMVGEVTTHLLVGLLVQQWKPDEPMDVMGVHLLRKNGGNDCFDHAENLMTHCSHSNPNQQAVKVRKYQ